MRGACTPSLTRSATPLSLLPSYPIPPAWEEVGPDVILNPFSPLPSRSRPPPPPWPWMCAWLNHPSSAGSSPEVVVAVARMACLWVCSPCAVLHMVLC